MNNQDLFHYRRLPARLTVEQVALLLGVLAYEIAILVRLGLLHPLGRPAPNGRKFFSAAEIQALSQNRDWLDKASRILTKHLQDKNRKQNSRKMEHNYA
ncbi:MAG: hypothetical protein HY298_20720 [Verrucomicrobia bacterium]|nr:hypothetical protein [Verrucomicrobiota bacterium]